MLGGTGLLTDRRNQTRKRRIVPSCLDRRSTSDGLKSWVPQGACGFDSRPRHEEYPGSPQGFAGGGASPKMAGSSKDQGRQPHSYFTKNDFARFLIAPMT